MTFLDHLSCGKIIKFQQSQALTSHFESFWLHSANLIFEKKRMFSFRALYLMISILQPHLEILAHRIQTSVLQPQQLLLLLQILMGESSMKYCLELVY